MAAGSEIKRLRGRISAKEVAALIGVDVERLRKWEQRDVDPRDTGDIEAVESYFGVPLDQLKNLDSFQFIPRNMAGKVDFTQQAILDLTYSNRQLTDNNTKMVDAVLNKMALLDEIKASLGSIPSNMTSLTDLIMKGQVDVVKELTTQISALNDRISNIANAPGKKPSRAGKR